VTEKTTLPDVETRRRLAAAEGLLRECRSALHRIRIAANGYASIANIADPLADRLDEWLARGEGGPPP
jgi:hypothetical protein